MDYFIKTVLFFVSLVICMFIGPYLFSYVYLLLPSDGANLGWWGSNANWSLLFGAFLAFYFFLSLLLVLFYNKIKYYLIPVVLILLLPVLWTFYSDFMFVVAIISCSLAGWLIGEGIMLGWKKIKGGK